MRRLRLGKGRSDGRQMLGLPEMKRRKRRES